MNFVVTDNCFSSQGHLGKLNVQITSNVSLRLRKDNLIKNVFTDILNGFQNLFFCQAHFGKLNVQITSNVSLSLSKANTKDFKIVNRLNTNYLLLNTFI